MKQSGFGPLLALGAAFATAALLFTAMAHGQTTCSAASPCVGVSWTDSSMAAAVVTNSSGVQTAGPGTAILWKCMGSQSSCSLAALDAAIASQTATALCPAAGSVWSCVTMPVTTANAGYNDAEPYSALMNYAVQDAWSTGGVSAVSPILIFSMPPAPTQVPVAPSAPMASLVTSGAVGPR